MEESPRLTYCRGGNKAYPRTGLYFSSTFQEFLNTETDALFLVNIKTSQLPWKSLICKRE